MKIYCVVCDQKKKVSKVFHHKKSAITWASLHDCPHDCKMSIDYSKGDCHLVVVSLDLDEYMKQIM